MTSVTVPVTMPAEVWGRLASRADDEGVTVAELIATAVHPYTLPRQKRGPASEELREHRLEVMVARRRAGWTWPQIAAELGTSVGTVYELARWHGLTGRKGKKA